MKKQYFFLSGLPRSGSTILAGLLGQNPNIHVSGTSGILNILQNIRNFWGDVPEFSALAPEISSVRKVGAMRGVLDGFYDDVSQNVVIDKCRGWPGQFEMAETILGEKPRAIITVRDIRDVLASFERLWREMKSKNMIPPHEKGSPVEYQTVEGRCRLLISQNQVVGGSVAMICDAVVRGWRDQMLFVEYDDLCLNPIGALEYIYDFFGLPRFKDHDPRNVIQSVVENDLPYGWVDLHKIRPVVAPQESQWPKYIPTEVAMQYTKDAKFWKNL